MYSKREIEAIKIVMDLNMKHMTFIDHFYCGDKDTYAEAFDSVMEEKGIEISFWDYPRDEAEKYEKIYESEIADKYSELVDWGKDQMDFLEKVNEHLKDLMGNVEANLNWNYFDFPQGEIEIDSTGFDPKDN